MICFFVSSVCVLSLIYQILRVWVFCFVTEEGRREGNEITEGYYGI